MDTLNDDIGQSKTAIPTERDLDGVIARTCLLPAPNTHGFTTANQEEDKE